jgi:hypothetical protein
MQQQAEEFLAYAHQVTFNMGERQKIAARLKANRRRLEQHIRHYDQRGFSDAKVWLRLIERLDAVAGGRDSEAG